jgi:hypothetical protein
VKSVILARILGNLIGVDRDPVRFKRDKAVYLHEVLGRFGRKERPVEQDHSGLSLGGIELMQRSSVKKMSSGTAVRKGK